MDKQNLKQIYNQLESIYKQAEDDQNAKIWGTYDILIEQYNNLKKNLQKTFPDLEVIKTGLPDIQTVPPGNRGAMKGGRPGAGTDSEKAKYSEILLKLRPIIASFYDIVKQPKKTHPNGQLNTCSTKVFIVHGHDNEAKIEVARFVEKLDFKPIILHEQASSGKTIIEKIEEYSNVGFGIVIYTPCDVGAKITDSKNLNKRARQNVVFEHGYLIGKLGRGRVCALIKNTVEIPNDITGVVYIQMDKKNAWHIDLAKEMREAGYKIDMNKII